MPTGQIRVNKPSCEESDCLYAALIDQHRTRLFGSFTHLEAKQSRFAPLTSRNCTAWQRRRRSSTLSVINHII